MARDKATKTLDDSELDGELPNFDELLVRVGKNQDKAAFSQIFAYFAPRLKSFLINNAISEGTAEELMQDVMIKVWRKAHQYKPDRAKASTWIYTIAKNKRIDLLRKNKRIVTIDEEDLRRMVSMDESQFENVSLDERSDIVQSALKKLPGDQRHAIERSFFDGLSHADISEQDNIPLGTVKSRLRLGMKRLRHAIENGERPITK